MTDDTRLLELRYRRLLLAYPREYRQTTGQELLWVLLASASDGQQWPTLADAADLTVHGLLERFRVWRQPDGSPRWQNGLALFSVAAPMVMLLAAVIELVWWHAANASEVLAAGLAAAVLLGWRKTALAVTGLAICMPLLPAHVDFLGLQPQWFGIYLVRWQFMVLDYRLWLLLLEAIALTCSAGPRRGRQLLTWPGAISLAVIGVMFSGVWLGPPIVNLAGLVAVVGALVVLARSSRPGRWAAALLALVLYPLVLQFLPFMYWLDSPAMLALRYLPPACIACLIGCAMLQARRRPASAA